jgi:hypothetical protein
MKLVAQAPAEGIFKHKEWGDSVMYGVTCECTDPTHQHNVWIEADECGVTVTTYTQQKTKWWELNRFQIIWRLLTQGYVEYESSIVMTRQQALNYADTLKQAVANVEEFRKKK